MRASLVKNDAVFYKENRIIFVLDQKVLTPCKRVVTDAINILCENDFSHAFTVPKRVSADERHAFGNGQTVDLRTV